MGKRKLHHSIYYQCDWTGLPMHKSHCYMPHVAKDKKGRQVIAKRGSYCNWESVVAHAYKMLCNQTAQLESGTGIVPVAVPQVRAQGPRDVR